MSTNSAFPLGVFVGGPNGSDSYAQSLVTSEFNSFVQTMGTSPQFMDGYVDQGQSINQWASNASWTAWSWASMPGASGTTPVIGLPMATDGDYGNPDAVFRDFASGKYDNVLQNLVQAWSDQGFKTQYWRPGYEMNVSSMPWYVGDNAQTQADYISAFQHISGVLHHAGNATGVDVKVVWSPNIMNWNNDINVMSLYPGNSAVDVMGPDQYDNMYPRDLYDWAKNNGTVDSSFQQWASNPINVEHYFTYPSGSQWHPTGDGQGNGQSLKQFIDFAKANGKSIAMSETGAGGGGNTDTWEDPAFVQWLANTLRNAGVPISYVNLWDTNANGSWDFSSGSAGKPLTAAAWRQYFGVGSGSTSAPAPAPAPIPAPMPSPTPSTAPAASTATSTAAAGTIVVNLSEEAWQGDAQVNLSVNGQQIGWSQTITANHDAGQSQSVTLQGSFNTSGQNVVTVNFLNDAWGGTAQTDRNVFVDSITVGNQTVQTNAALYSAGPQDFTVPAASISSSSNMAFALPQTVQLATGDASLTAVASETLDFTGVGYGNDTIAGFDPSTDVLKISRMLAPDFAAIQNDLQSSGGNTVITLGSSHSITLQGMVPQALTASNFAFA